MHTVSVFLLCALCCFIAGSGAQTIACQDAFQLVLSTADDSVTYVGSFQGIQFVKCEDNIECVREEPCTSTTTALSCLTRMPCEPTADGTMPKCYSKRPCFTTPAPTTTTTTIRTTTLTPTVTAPPPAPCNATNTLMLVKSPTGFTLRRIFSGKGIKLRPCPNITGGTVSSVGCYEVRECKVSMTELSRAPSKACYIREPCVSVSGASSCLRAKPCTPITDVTTTTTTPVPTTPFPCTDEAITLRRSKRGISFRLVSEGFRFRPCRFNSTVQGVRCLVREACKSRDPKLPECLQTNQCSISSATASRLPCFTPVSCVPPKQTTTTTTTTTPTPTTTAPPPTLPPCDPTTAVHVELASEGFALFRLREGNGFTFVRCPNTNGCYMRVACSISSTGVILPVGVQECFTGAPNCATPTGIPPSCLAVRPCFG